MDVNSKQAIDFITRCFRANLTCMLSGSPGIGKSSIIASIAENYGMELIDIRLSTYDPIDIAGIPMIKGDVCSFIPMDTFPLEGRDTPPNGKSGWIILLDELNSASLAVQAAAYQLVLDRQVGQHKLHSKALIVCAGNLATDGAIVNRMGTAMQSRLIHLNLKIGIKGWLVWAANNDIDHRVMAYVNNVPTNLHNFDPKHDDVTFACPRTWEFLSRLIKGIPTEGLRELTPLLAGTVSTSVATEFISYTSVYSQIPDYKAILSNPAGEVVKKEPAMLFAMSHMIASHLEKKDLDKIMIYIERMPPEFQTTTLQGVMQRDSSLIKEKVIMDWIAKYGAILL